MDGVWRSVLGSTCRRCLLLGAVLISATGPAWADATNRAFGLVEGDGAFGSHLSDRTYAGLVYDWDWSEDWASYLPWGLVIYPEANLARWRGCSGMLCGDITDVGITPVFRKRMMTAAGTLWYMDAGLGAHLISHTRIGPQVYSTAFQFSELVGAGWLLGEDGRYDIGARYMHESNADWKKPNDGMNFTLLRLAVHWR